MAEPIYLDNNATTAVDPRVLAEMLPLFDKNYGNPASKTHPFGWFAEETVKIARERVAALIDAAPDQIIFTSGATESNNLALLGNFEAAGGAAAVRLVTDVIEHRSVLDCAEEIKRRGGQVSLCPVEKNGLVDPAKLAGLVSSQTTMISLMLGNNEIGTLFDLPALVTVCRSRAPQALIHCDAVQSAGKIPLSVAALGADLLSLSAHKLYGPKGIGALWIGPRAASRIKPIIFGGGHERGFRSGTLNVPAIAGFGKACEIAQTQLTEDAEKVLKLSRRFFDKLKAALPGISLNGSAERRLPGNLNIRIPGVESGPLFSLIATKVALSAGSACTSGDPGGSFVLRALGLDQTAAKESIRVGFGRFNTGEEADRAAEILAAEAGK